MVPALSYICQVSGIFIRPDVISLYINGYFNFRIAYLKRGIFQSSFISMLLKLMLIIRYYNNLQIYFTNK